ncbi:uncharacterized protein LOC132638388 [Lycium barbarum]|uniref:uncharacterized protein LOC132638388 n=1 Tax=Lycium barbarum TaxID=112863 RepID=UPI00293E9D7B|nr:uncharacterized protein LOC132638388 [Lycium barbarum]
MITRLALLFFVLMTMLTSHECWDICRRGYEDPPPPPAATRNGNRYGTNAWPHLKCIPGKVEGHTCWCCATTSGVGCFATMAECLFNKKCDVYRGPPAGIP